MKKINNKKSSILFDVVLDNNDALSDEDENENKYTDKNTDIVGGNKKVKTKQKQKQFKNEVYKKDQDRLFEDIKKIIKLTSNNTFLSSTIVENNEKITGEIFEEMKKYFHFKMWSRINSDTTKSSITVLKKIFAYYNLDIVSKEYHKTDVRGTKYYVVPIDNTF